MGAGRLSEAAFARQADHQPVKYRKYRNQPIGTLTGLPRFAYSAHKRMPVLRWDGLLVFGRGLVDPPVVLLDEVDELVARLEKRVWV
jgi:hypothetical protein